jgi:hypothetical protein
MNKTLIFFCLSASVLALSIIVVCISPVINNITVGSWKISSWRTLNCKLYEDQLNDEEVKLDDIQKYKKINKLCKAKKAMHDLEFACLFINLVLGFVCANLSLLHSLEVGKDFEKKTGMIGFATGIIGFIITLVYVCFNGYVFNNDMAYWNNDMIEKLYPNGAILKKDGSDFIPIYYNDKSVFSEYAKYKDLGDKQYNYDSKYYKSYEYTSAGCKNRVNPSLSCEYVYYRPFTSFENKDLYDRWLTTLILSIALVACNIGLLIFGFLLFKNGQDSNEPKTVEIQ